MAVALKFTGSDAGARATAEALAKSLDQLGISADNVKFVFNENQKAGASLFQQARGWQREQMQQARTARFFANELASVIPIASDAKGMLAGLTNVLVEGAAGGLSFGLAFAGVQLVTQYFHAMAEAVRKAKEELDKVTEAEQRAWAAAATSEIEKAIRERTLLEGKLAEAQKKVAKTTQDVTDAEKAWADATEANVFLWKSMEELRLKQQTALKEETKLRWDLVAAINAQNSRSEALFDKLLARMEKEEREREARKKKAIDDAKREAETERLVWEAQAEIESRRFSRKLAPEFESPILDIGDPEKQKKEAADAKRRLDDARKVKAEWVAVGTAVGDAFATLGETFGGAAGKMMGLFGSLIQRAIQLAVAMSATGGPFAWVNLPATLGAIMAVISSVAKFEQGTPYVPRTGLAMLHEGEAVIPAEQNRAGFGGNLTVNFNAPVDRDWWHQNQEHILREMRDAARNRRSF